MPNLDERLARAILLIAQPMLCLSRRCSAQIAGGCAMLVWLAAVAAGCSHSIEPPISPPVQASDTAPSWSSDGQYLAYVHFTPDDSDTTFPSGIYITNLVGQTRLIAADATARAVDWSPDGRWLVLSDYAGLELVQPSGDSLHTIYYGGSYPSWSPSGDWIAFSTISRVWAIQPDGSGLRPLTPPDSIAVDPDWSPDGAELVVLGNPHSVGEEIMIVPLDGGPFRRLTNDAHEDRSPAWSPQGGQIAWNALPIAGGVVRPQIWVADTLGQNAHLVTPAASSVSWDPTGSRLAFSKLTPQGPRLFVVRIDGTGLEQITH